MKLKIHWTRTKIISLVGAILILGLGGWLLWKNGYVGADVAGKSGIDTESAVALGNSSKQFLSKEISESSAVSATNSQPQAKIKAIIISSAPDAYYGGVYSYYFFDLEHDKIVKKMQQLSIASDKILSNKRAKLIDIQAACLSISQNSTNGFAFVYIQTDAFKSDAQGLAYFMDANNEKVYIKDISNWLKPANPTVQTQVIFIGGSYSGKAIAELTAKKRIIITATRADRNDFLATHISGTDAFANSIKYNRKWKAVYTEMEETLKDSLPWKDLGYPTKFLYPKPQLDDPSNLANFVIR